MSRDQKAELIAKHVRLIRKARVEKKQAEADARTDYDALAREQMYSNDLDIVVHTVTSGQVLAGHRC